MQAFTNTVLATINHISLPSQLDGEDPKYFEVISAGWCLLPVQVHVFDFKGVEKIMPSFYPLATKFKKNAELHRTKLISINVSPRLLERLKADDMELTFGYMKDTNLAHRPTSKDTLEEARTWMIKYAVEAGRAAMNMMFNTTVAADENYRETPKDFKAEKFFKVAIIRGDTPRFKVVFRLFFERNTLEALTQTIADATRTDVDQELLLSTATELLNIIYTSVKSKVNDERGYALPPAIPALLDPVQAAQDKGIMGRGASWVPFVTPLGAYYLQIELGA